MTCPPYVTSSRGRQGVGVVQPQSGLDYPLVKPSNDIKYLLADFYFSYDDDGEYLSSVPPAAHPLSIKYLYGVGCIENTPTTGFPTPVHSADIVIVDANGRTIFNTNNAAVSFNVQDWSADYKIYEWKNDKAVCRAVAYTTWPDDDYGMTDDDTRRNYNKYLTPANAKLDERAVYKMPKRLLSLRVKNGTNLTNRYKNKITFVNGYNTTIVPAPTVSNNFRADTGVLFSAVAGSGLGKYGNCPELSAQKPITKINGVTGNNGNFLLSSTDCLWTRRPVVTTFDYPKILDEIGNILLTETTLYNLTLEYFRGAEFAVLPSITAQQKIGADCEPCCSCSDYVDTAKYLNDTSYRYKLIGNRAGKVRDEHENNIARWMNQRACSIMRPLKLLMVPQRCPFIDIVMLQCNPCDQCAPPATLTVALSIDTSLVVTPGPGEQPPVVTPALECGYTEIVAPGIKSSAVGISVTNNGLQYSAAFPQLKPGESAHVKFRVRFDQATSKARGPYAVTGVLTGTILSTNTPVLSNCGANLLDGSAAPAAGDEVTRTLNCNQNGQTELPC